MNITLSYNWIREYIKTSKTPQEFAKIFSLHSQSIERIREIKPRWKNVVTAKIVEIRPHPRADRLSLARVDIGKREFTAVCGAPNIKVGHIVPLVHEGGEIVGENNQTRVVKKANIRGVESFGMLCSCRELGLGDDHSGIYILPDNTPLGVPLEKIAPAHDVLFDIEVTSNRPDCMSVIGIAREACAVFGERFHIPQKPVIAWKTKKQILARVKDTKICPRYQATVVENVRVAPSPLWLQMRLIHAGVRPINSIVDITNYILFEYGQPIHAFDYDKIQTSKSKGVFLEVRKAKTGEKLFALDQNTYELSLQDIVVADAQGPVALAGIIGGRESGVDENTKTVIFESANFDPVSVRRTSRRLSILTQSSNLFEKGLRPEATEGAIHRALELAIQHCGGSVASKIIDVKKPFLRQKKIKLNPQKANAFLGTDISPSKMRSILTLLGAKVAGTQQIHCAVPWWREGDLKLELDLYEEIARLHGYHKISSDLPEGKIPVRQKDPREVLRKKCKRLLEGIGCVEVYSYSMVSRSMMTSVGIEAKNAIKIFNPLSEDMVYMRTTLIPSLLKILSENQDKKNTLSLFEISNVYIPRPDTLPEETLKLALALVGQEKIFLRCKGIVEFLLESLGITALFHATQESMIWRAGASHDIVAGEKVMGRFGIIQKNIGERFGINKEVAFLSIDFSCLASQANVCKKFAPLPLYPGIERDIAIVIGKNVLWKNIYEYVVQFHELIERVSFISEYASPEFHGGRSIAFRAHFRSKDRTLKSSEIDSIIQKIRIGLQKVFNARLR